MHSIYGLLPSEATQTSYSLLARCSPTVRMNSPPASRRLNTGWFALKYAAPANITTAKITQIRLSIGVLL